MGWPKGKPRKPELYGAGAALEAAESSRPHAPQPPPIANDGDDAVIDLIYRDVAWTSMADNAVTSPITNIYSDSPLANDGDGDVLMRRNGRVTEVHPDSVPIMEDLGWQRCDFDC